MRFILAGAIIFNRRQRVNLIFVRAAINLISLNKIAPNNNTFEDNLKCEENWRGCIIDISIVPLLFLYLSRTNSTTSDDDLHRWREYALIPLDARRNR